MVMTLKFCGIGRDLGHQSSAEIRRIAIMMIVGDIIPASKAIDDEPASPHCF